MLGGVAPACSSRWAVPGDGFFEWLAGDEQEADAVVTVKSAFAGEIMPGLRATLT
jgi:hypothetical protein